jgi:DNA-binding CsgD family transcriptional regulator
MTAHPYLTPNEHTALQMLADDKSYNAIKRVFNLTALSLCAFLAAIRRKTGIEDTSKASLVQHYLTEFAQTQSLTPTDDQREIVQRALGVGSTRDTFQGIAYLKKRPEAEIRELYESGLKAMGIFAKEDRERRVQSRAYFAREIPAQGAEGLTKKHLLALRMYADGLKEKQIISDLLALNLPATHIYVDFLIKDGCKKLGVTARGRGVQRKLVGIALDEHERKMKPATPAPTTAPVSMDDPMF